MARRWSTLERELRGAEQSALLAGVDEVGRGPIAGPVVACAIVMQPGRRAIAGVNDSKKLSRSERERLAPRILAHAVAVGIGAASVLEIDRHNIYNATVFAIRRALSKLDVVPAHVLIDGLPIRTLDIPHRAVVGGDASCFSIACASIIAKVTRDRLMHRLAQRYPDFLWERNAGYGTAAHLAALERHGMTAHHRRSFLQGRQLELELGE